MSWMSLPDFMRYFDGIDVCEVERGISDLTLNAHEIGAWKAKRVVLVLRCKFSKLRQP